MKKIINELIEWFVLFGFFSTIALLGITWYEHHQTKRILGLPSSYAVKPGGYDPTCEAFSYRSPAYPRHPNDTRVLTPEEDNNETDRAYWPKP